jgi:hypothetical protein
MDDKYIPIYTTRDSEEASLLIALENDFVGEEWKGSICYFNFSDRDACEEILIAFRNGKITIDPRVIFEAQRQVRKIVNNR